MSNERKNISEDYEIVEYDNLIKKEDAQNIFSFLDEVDKYKSWYLKTLISVIESEEYGPAKKLQILYRLKKNLSKRINIYKTEIPNIANIDFVLKGELKSGEIMLFKLPPYRNNKIVRSRDASIEHYKKQIRNYLAIQLDNLLLDLENIISQFENLGRFPDLKDWYPSFKNETITRIQIFEKAQEYKNNGMSVSNMFEEIENWLLNELGFSREEIKKRFNFSLEDAHSFNRLVNKHTSFHS